MIPREESESYRLRWIQLGTKFVQKNEICKKIHYYRQSFCSWGSSKGTWKRVTRQWLQKDQKMYRLRDWPINVWSQPHVPLPLTNTFWPCSLSMQVKQQKASQVSSFLHPFHLAPNQSTTAMKKSQLKC